RRADRAVVGVDAGSPDLILAPCRRADVEEPRACLVAKGDGVVGPAGAPDLRLDAARCRRASGARHVARAGAVGTGAVPVRVPGAGAAVVLPRPGELLAVGAQRELDGARVARPLARRRLVPAAPEAVAADRPGHAPLVVRVRAGHRRPRLRELHEPPLGVP